MVPSLSRSLAHPPHVCGSSPLVGAPRLDRREARPLAACACRLPLAAAPERVFSGNRARTAAPVHYALVALIDPLSRVLSVQNPPPPDKPPDTAPDRIIYVPPIASTV